MQHSIPESPSTTNKHPFASVRSNIEAMITSQIASQLRLPPPEAGDRAEPSAASTTTNSIDPLRATSSKSPSKNRSLSDSTPKLSPSPKLREPKNVSKDDHTIIASPTTPRRPDFLSRGLSLQMPPRDGGMQSPVQLTHRVPLSPQVDTRNIYGSPAKVLPRHSRGLDFSRACTNLHHSTLAEQSSPDSSPTVTQKGIMIPKRPTPLHDMIVDSPNANTGMAWTTSNNPDRTAPSSVSSNMMLMSSDSDSDSDDDENMDGDEDEIMISTPQVSKMHNPNATTPFAIHTQQNNNASGSGSQNNWSSVFSPGPGAFMEFQRARLRKGRSRKSSSSASGHSSLASPVPQSPPQSRNGDNGGGYFAREVAMRSTTSRRESLSMSTWELNISSGNDSGDEASKPPPTTPGVVQRPVTRRGNLKPKSRAFSRIQSEMLEESAPIDAEVKREAEVVRQVLESDTDLERHPSNGDSSPNLPAVPGMPDTLEDIPEDNAMGIDMGNTTKYGSFSQQAVRNSGGKDFWKSFDLQMRTPPPPTFWPRGSSSGISDDMVMDSPTLTGPTNSIFSNIQQSGETTRDPGQSRASTPQPFAPPTAVDGLRKNNKRRRDDDLDGLSMKRRAVSPGMSVQNSPILSQSPGQRENSLWGTTKASREGSVAGGHAAGERSNSNGSLSSVAPNIGPKRIGLQGMTDTNDGLMKMSIE
ncbi:hypothetical protein K402DRAFT_363491 [Aulographum hederae CBS 113979]|uniref:Uncharacterized protein n=1 Tax=Aulographum hederae CBS 113979 TaxID=1176131 RepID=A0A6G1GMY2_9PEZI|nr:hypothetical protein K402DRAFT_363491 [Aulographum hederae CBS 113979]